MKSAIIVDLDGTLANIEHRVHHVQKEKKDWRAFNEGIPNDEINVWCLDLIESMKKNDFDILLLTGRSENCRGMSEDWLLKHNISFDKLFMRSKKDRREDFVIKQEIYETIIKKSWAVSFVVDDRLSVVKMWRKINVPCLQCDWGDF